jgi:hypothetical protein
MKFIKWFWHSNFIIKLRSWEYWPFGIVQAPAFIYWLWLSLKARSLFFFSASNPGIPTGGMFGESKFDILKKIPAAVRPKAVKVTYPTPVEDITKIIRDNQFTFPVIFKPDIGERGWMVKRIKTFDDVKNYQAGIKCDFIIQEYIDLPMEFGIFYTRYPGRAEGNVTSVTMKEMLYVEGDGKQTLKDLILAKPRAKLHWTELEQIHAARLDEVLSKGERIELVSIGNHCLGTMFLNGNHLITEKLSAVFNRISRQVEGFYFGRYDLRAASVADLEEGRVMIMELNGCGAEPAHIYHPGSSFWKAVRVLLNHFNVMYQISIANNKLGVPFLSFSEGVRMYKKFKAITSGQ